MQTSFDFTANESHVAPRNSEKAEYIRAGLEWLENGKQPVHVLPENCFRLSVTHGFGRAGVANMERELHKDRCAKESAQFLRAELAS